MKGKWLILLVGLLLALTWIPGVAQDPDARTLLQASLKAMGGELELIARFPDRPPVRLQELGGTSPRRKRDRRTAA